MNAKVSSLLSESILRAIKESTDVDFECSDESKALLDQAVSENDDKKKTALIINATEMTGRFSSKYGDFDIDDFLEITCSELWDTEPYERFYDDRVVEKYKKDLEAPYPTAHLMKISDKSILSVRMEGGMPRSVIFNELDSPICSMAFFGIIQEIRFGSPADYYYDPKDYGQTRAFLETNGYLLPDNIYQTHYFMVYIQKYLTPMYIEVLMRDYHQRGLTGVFDLINILQARHGQKTAILNDRKGAEDDIGDQINEEYMRNIATANWGNLEPGPCEGCLVINEYGIGAVHDGLLYNKGEKRYMGAYYAGECGGHSLYRSVPDYLNSEISLPCCFLLLVVFRTYVHDNNISVNDGLEYELDDSGDVVLTTDGFDFSGYEEGIDAVGEIIAEGTDIELDKFKMSFRCGWSGSVPW